MHFRSGASERLCVGCLRALIESQKGRSELHAQDVLGFVDVSYEDLNELKIQFIGLDGLVEILEFLGMDNDR